MGTGTRTRPRTPSRVVEAWAAQSVFTRAPEGARFGFQYSANPYRGCAHACRYCYARTTHTYLGLQPGRDFETHLFVKVGVGRRARAELRRIPQDASIAIGTATDPYQPLEGRHRVTRTLIEALAESGHPFTITTKSPLVLRDLDLLVPCARRQQVVVHISLIALDRALLSWLEPGAPPPAARLKTIAALSQAGVPVTLFLAPILPALTDQPPAMAALLQAARAAGAQAVMAGPGRLEEPVREYLVEALTVHRPELVASYRRWFCTPGGAPPLAWRQQVLAQAQASATEVGLSWGGPKPRPAPPAAQLRFPFA
ncbi:MAG: radical SAM protein [Firmicutes bacterium]|nr:radical SAM protein [Alicyclobacillaceae bacterium]MCL6496325.1 radical SAM protein [Bacillota bacterium]